MLKATHFMYYLLVVHIFCSIFATYLTKLLRKGIYLLCKKQIIYDKTYNIKYRKDPKEVVKYCRSGKYTLDVKNASCVIFAQRDSFTFTK